MNSQIPRKVVKTLILIGFVYQLYDLTADYLRYNYLIEVDVRPGIAVVPSVTVCVNEYQRDAGSVISLQNDGINWSIVCVYSPIHVEWEDCLDIDETVWIRRKDNSICLTFLNSDKRILGNSTFIFCSVILRRTEFIFHPAFTHSHFERANRIVLYEELIDKKPNQAHIQMKKWEQTLLPFPFLTNCFDYSINRQNNIRPKSQTY